MSTCSKDGSKRIIFWEGAHCVKNTIKITIKNAGTFYLTTWIYWCSLLKGKISFAKLKFLNLKLHLQRDWLYLPNSRQEYSIPSEGTFQFWIQQGWRLGNLSLSSKPDETVQKISSGIFRETICRFPSSKIEFCLEARLVGEQLEISSRVSSSWNEILMPDPRGSLLAYFTIWRWSNGDRMREKTVSILDAGHNQKMAHTTMCSKRPEHCWW